MAIEHAKHHAVVAIVVASVLTLLHQAGLLNWLDAAMLRIVGAANITAPHSRTLDAGKLPVVLLLGNEAFETVFFQESPLDRGKLASLIESISTQCPKTLAIDLDLSPGPEGAQSNVSQPALDAALLRSLRRCPSPITLVLPAPVPVQTRVLIDRKFAWMKRMCDAGVRFAFADVSLTQGAVLQFDPDLPTVGAVAAIPNLADSPCAAVATGRESAFFLHTASLGQSHANPARFVHMVPFNAAYFRAEPANSFALTSPEVSRNLAGRTVFLGGAYGHADRFITAFREDTPGVSIHAATYFSIVDPVSRVEKGWAFALDFLLGFAFGYVFHWSWCGHERAIRGLAGVNAAAWFGPYLRARAWLVGNFALLIVAVLTLVLISGLTLYPRNIWVNPGPIILGVFLKSLLASHSGRHFCHDHAANPVAHQGPAKFPAGAIHADRMIATAIVLLCLVMLVLGSH